MRRLTILLAAGLLLSPIGCKKPRKRAPVAVSAAGDTTVMATMVQVADPRAEVQLVKGFYPVESDAWRWTMHEFSVSLRAPKNGAQQGARLVLKFAIPDISIQKLKAMKLSAKVNGLDLPPEEYTRSGDQTFTRDVPASALKADTIAVDFTLDKYLPPSATDQRELGVIVSAVGFEAK